MGRRHVAVDTCPTGVVKNRIKGHNSSMDSSGNKKSESNTEGAPKSKSDGGGSGMETQNAEDGKKRAKGSESGEAPQNNRRPAGKKPYGSEWDTSVAGRSSQDEDTESDVEEFKVPYNRPVASRKRKTPPSSRRGKTKPEIHPRSKWQEPDRADGLTLYERHRSPRPVLSGTIQRPADSILQSFRCAICLDTIEKAVVVECLHRFCEECIERALRVGRSSGQCPICRVSIPSKRCLVRDPDFDRLVKAVVGKAMAFEKPSVPLPNLPAVTLQKAISQKHKEQSNVSERVPSAALDKAETEKYAGLLDGPSVIDIALLRHETEDDQNTLDPLSLPYLRLLESATIETLKRFLQQKLNLAPHLKLQIFSFVEQGKPVILTDWLTLLNVSQTFAEGTGLLELYYRIEPKKRKRKQRRVKRIPPAIC